MPSFRVVSFNIRCATADDAQNNWIHRRELFFRAIGRLDPDILGTQEAVASQADELRQRMPDYGFVGAGRDDGRRGGEFCPILYRRQRFALVDHGHFWLSHTPDVPGSIGWDAALTRLATWIRLRDRLHEEPELLVLNTHWDHVGQLARLESAKLIRRKLADLGGASTQLPGIIAGDFNVEEDSPAGRLLAEGLIDSYRAVHPEPKRDEATWHAFSGRTDGSRIDFIFHTPHFQTIDAGIDRWHENGRYPSDHYPVVATVKWKEPPMNSDPRR